MKIHKLILKNINSLKGENSIDFKKNFDNSIFLITGDTGAGKSTILDAICCALYNETPRLKDARAILTKHTAEANITLEYEVKNSIYRNSWSIQRAYKKVSGEVAKAPKMEMAKLDEVSGEFEILETKISLIPKMVQEITGLDFSQLQKSMLLSQGNFDAFLKANVNERADLLEKMTGSGIYTKIGIKTFEVYKTKKQDIENLKLKLGEIIVLESSVLKEYEDEVKKLKKDSEILSIEQKKKQNFLDELNKKETILSDIKNYTKLLEDSKLKQNRLDDEREILAKDLKQQQKLYDDFILAYKKELKIIDDVIVLDLKIQNSKEGEESIKKRVKQLLKDADKFQKDKKLKLENIEKLKSQNLESAEYLKLNNFDESLLEDFKILSLKIESFLKLQATKNQDSKLKVELEKVLEDDTKKLSLNKKNLQKYLEKLNYLESKIVVLKYEDDRECLKDGEPCPLCGSSTHPYKDDLPKITESILTEKSQLLKEIKVCEEMVDSLEVLLIKNSAKLESLDENITIKDRDLKTVVEDLEPYFNRYNFSVDSDLEVLKDKFKTRFELYNTHKIKVDSFQKELDSCNHQLEILKTKEEVNQKDNKDETKRLENLQLENKKLITKREHIYAFKDTKESKKELESSKNIWDEKLKTLHTNKQKNQIEIESIIKKIEEFNDLRDKKNKILKTLSSEFSVDDKDKLLALSVTIQSELEEINRNYGVLSEKLEENSSKLKASKKYLDEIDIKQKAIKPYEVLNDFIGSADGKKFKRFAQNLTLGHLLSLANKHLKTLNERYFLVKDKTKDLEILVVDRYLGDSERSVNSLSGGEGFLVSLSLALGLSDMVSSKVSIESLFLDEGFGTLDSKTLNDALTTLSKLQDSGKMIGIISHVEELKNSISLQIEVKKGSGGVGIIKI